MKIAPVFRILFLLLIAVHPVVGQTINESVFEPGKKYLLLAHPTVHNLKTILYLTQNKIFDLEGAEMMGIYYSEEAYDFRQSVDFLEKGNISNIHLQEINGTLSVNNIFEENECTEQFRNVFDHSSGIIFFGGPDIMPEAYGEKNQYSEVTDPNRHLFELSLLFHLLGGSQSSDFVPWLEERPDYLITGFCLGMQSMNVATGGTLYQDIPAQLYNATTDEEKVALPKNQLHRNYWQNISKDESLMGVNFHRIRFAGSFFCKRVGAGLLFPPKVLSSHHQAVNELGKGWQITACSRDRKIVEGLCHTEYPNVFAVQFHPEVPALYEDQELRRFAPEDQPKTYHRIIGKRGLKFHKKYWQFISHAWDDAMN